MELQMLLEEQDSVKIKITAALKSLKEWFLAKIEQLKDVFTSMKLKVLKKLRTFKTGSVSTKDVKTKDGTKIISKGDTIESVKGKVRGLLGTMKKDSDSAIKDCKAGVNAISRGDKKVAITLKNAANKTFTLIVATVSALGAAMGAIAHKNLKDEVNKELGLNEEMDERYMDEELDSLAEGLDMDDSLDEGFFSSSTPEEKEKKRADQEKAQAQKARDRERAAAQKHREETQAKINQHIAMQKRVNDSI